MTLHRNSTRWLARLGVVGTGTALVVGSLAISPAAAQGDASAEVIGDTLHVTGSQGADLVTLRLAPGAPGTLEVDFGGAGSSPAFDRSTFSHIVVAAGNGDDRIRVDQTNGTFADEAITVEGGNGDDDFVGGDGAELFVGGRGDDTTDPNRGVDTAYLGSGNDSFRWDPGDGSDVVEGEAGDDTLQFLGAAIAENMTLTRNGTRELFVRDPGNIRMDTDGIERFDVTTLGGKDTFTAGDLAGSDVRAVNVDLSGPAGGPDGLGDTVTVTGTAGADTVDLTASGGRIDVAGLAATVRVLGAETGEISDVLQVNTLGGDDSVRVADAVNALVKVGIDLGADQS